MLKEVFMIGEIEYAVKKPTNKDFQQAQKHYNLAFADAINSKAVLRAKIEQVMRAQNLWDDEKDREINTLQDEIKELEKTLAKGGIKLAEAYQYALKIRDNRAKIRLLNIDRISLDNHTAEAQADNMRFNYLVSSCTVYNDNGKVVFANLDEYLERSNEEIAVQAAEILGRMVYNYDKDWEKKLPEVKFLLKYKFVDDKLRFINKQGKLVDREGRLVNNDGRYVNEQNEFVDINGNRVDEEGNLMVEFKPFLDDNGNSI